MKYSIDRIENSLAVLQNIETLELIDVEIDKLPNDVTEGDILLYNDGEYTLDKDTTAKRKENIKKRFNDLLKK